MADEYVNVQVVTRMPVPKTRLEVINDELHQALTHLRCAQYAAARASREDPRPEEADEWADARALCGRLYDDLHATNTHVGRCLMRARQVEALAMLSAKPTSASASITFPKASSSSSARE